MTLPDERYRAVAQTRIFLESLVTRRSGLSKEVKEEARALLRHYPSDYDLNQAGEAAPMVFQKRMEPLYRMVKQYKQDKENGNNNQTR
jgi:hypothetical protein